MENPETKPSALGSFFKGFLNSAGSGAAMSGIFYGMAIVALKLFAFNPLHLGTAVSAFGASLGVIPGTAAAAVLGVLPVALFMVTAIGVFGGVMAIKRDIDEAKAVAAETTTTVTRQRSTDLAPVIVPMVGAVSADRAEAPESSPDTANWTDRTGGGHRDRIQSILANGSLTDKDRASAILAEREASATAVQRG